MDLFSRRVLADHLTPVSIYAGVRSFFPGECSFLFESAAVSGDSGKFSFVIIGAREEIISYKNQSFFCDSHGRRPINANPFEFLKAYYTAINSSAYRQAAQELDVPFVDGFMGFIGYDMVKFFEPCLQRVMDDLENQVDLPDMHLVRPRLILCYAHRTNHLTMIGHDVAVAESFDALIHFFALKTPESTLTLFSRKKQGEFHLSQEQFFDIVDQSLEHIHCGDIFQILISNRFSQPGSIDPLSFYRLLRSKNPSPYLFLLEFNGFAIAGSSPEVMIRLQEGSILLRPIAGTRKRGKNRVRDRELEQELKSDEKERAEHLMLLDLGRNDLGRVAKSGSVKVGEIMRVEHYSHVMHMVTDIEAELEEGKDMFDLFAATFTAGTMTGAPKIKAMELIGRLEGLKRGFYSGAVGYFGFDGNMDSAITIRTALITPEATYLQAGAGIVADSQKDLEYLEVKNKLGALMSVLDELAGE